MDSSIGKDIQSGLKTVLILCVLGAFTLGAMFMWGIPYVWNLIKPWLHQITG